MIIIITIQYLFYIEKIIEKYINISQINSALRVIKSNGTKCLLDLKNLQQIHTDKIDVDV